MSKGKNEDVVYAGPSLPAAESTPVASPVASPVLEDLDTKIANAIERALSAALPLAVGVATKTMQAAAVPAMKAKHKSSLGGKCQVCRQFLVACKGKHRKMVVYPQDPYWARHFQGIRLNSVTYCSNNARHQIWVPEDNSFESDVEKFENKERDLFQKKYRQHNSGDIRNPRQDNWQTEAEVSR